MDQSVLVAIKKLNDMRIRQIKTADENETTKELQLEYSERISDLVDKLLSGQNTFETPQEHKKEQNKQEPGLILPEGIVHTESKHADFKRQEPDFKISFKQKSLKERVQDTMK